MSEDGQGKDKVFTREFDKCPACGKSELFLGGIAAELKERGVVDKEWNFYYDQRQGVVMQPNKDLALPIGSEMPGYYFATDICSNCGCIYVVKLQRLNLKKSLAPAQMMLNRADRRRMEKEGFNPLGGNNPLLS